jgi:MerR family transcriptional regulator, thiopeptide resistance regulator
MAYTVKKLAQLSGVSIRTLHWYDEVGLLKPAYYGTNGYRYYEEEQLLVLQQILFFRELGFELKQIKKVLGRGDFDKLVALSSHRTILQKKVERTRKLIKTIDKTIEHIKGIKKMKESDFYRGFSKEKQAAYEKEIIERFGEQGKQAVEESRQNVKDWSKADWDASKKTFDQICTQLAALLEKGAKASSSEVQSVIGQHYKWLKHFWTPNKESYAAHGQFILESELRKAYEVYNQHLPEFLAEGIHCYSKTSL